MRTIARVDAAPRAEDDASTPRRTRSLDRGTEPGAQGCPRGRDLRHRSVRATEPHDTSANSRRTRQTLTSQRCSRNSRAASVLLPLAQLAAPGNKVYPARLQGASDIRYHIAAVVSHPPGMNDHASER